ncbi:ABC1 kinase family protein [Aquabacterium parvum]|uniref:ABC1 kinase family protein n=1 Tax=Aquabacterium parvum TaxID=70584 RepID=UPI000B02A4B7|nr:AarF/ABC1/UbiB kinase family protein [Aquabacterium parvum]
MPPHTPPSAEPPAAALPRQASVPEGRLSRSLHLGRLAGELLAGAVATGAGQLVRGERPSWAGSFLTPGNAHRLTERLAQMRGAVMKVGQMLSMDGQGVLPAPFADLLARLRDQAYAMPATQLAEVLEREYGNGWHRRFKQFSFAPIAAASIGQVHRAETHEGEVLALKVQYPGVRASIDSDVANLALLLRVPGLTPPGVEMDGLLAQLRAQLHAETDYTAEARAATAYRELLGQVHDLPDLFVPRVHTEHSTAHILAMAFAPGQPVGSLLQPGVPQAQRDRVAASLCRLAVKEFFGMRLVQTDPNFGNYLFDPATGRIGLLDFGAAQAVSAERVEQVRELGRALRQAHRQRTLNAALALGLVHASDTSAQQAGVVQLLLAVGEPLRATGLYDFGTSRLVKEVFEQGQAQFLETGYGQPPPADVLLLQRKFVGTFLLCAKLAARVDLGEVFGAELDESAAHTLS